MKDLLVGIDIGGTGVKLGLVTRTGEMVRRDSIETPAEMDPAEGVAHIAAAVKRLVGVEQVGRQQLDAGQVGAGQVGVEQVGWQQGHAEQGRSVGALGLPVGVGCAGLVDMTGGILRTSPNLPRWREVALGDLFARELRVPVAVLNDANAFALAEARVGAGRGMSPMVGLTLGTGVGGGVVLRGHLYGGRHGFAGEIGHTTIDYQGERCPCGNRGCLELMVGRRPILTDYFRRAAWEPGMPAYDFVQGRREDLTPEHLARAAEAGEEAARASWEAAGVALGAALASFANLFDPQILVIGGGLAQAGDLIFEPARRTMTERAMADPNDQPPVVPATLGTDAGLIGAALFALDQEGAGDESR